MLLLRVNPVAASALSWLALGSSPSISSSNTQASAVLAEPVETPSSTPAAAGVALAYASLLPTPPEPPPSAGDAELASLTTRPSFFKNRQCLIPLHFC